MRIVEASSAALVPQRSRPRRAQLARSPRTATPAARDRRPRARETARYRELVVDLENNAPPPLLDGPNAPDDLKLIVGIGPVLERMLHQLGVDHVPADRALERARHRRVRRAACPEFPGRIRRDAWVTQARELHQSKFGETLPTRER